MWFESLMGFAEESPEQVRRNIIVDGPLMYSRVNGRTVGCGRLETPSLAELRQRVAAARPRQGSVRVAEMVGDVQRLHEDPDGAGAMFQVASQFNLLEMVAPAVAPEQGVGIYDYDATQGPACAIAAGAGTIYRNYFVQVGPDGAVLDASPAARQPIDANAEEKETPRGQTAQRQLDGAAALGERLGNRDQRLWRMENGYLLPSADGLGEVNRQLAAASEEELDALRGELRIGLHWNVEVTSSEARHCVSQAYCSATPVSYSDLPAEQWEPLARLVLEASYEATMWASLLPERVGPNRALSLTLLGGGAFGNASEWIFDAIERSLALVKRQGYAMDVAVVSYGASQPEVAALASRHHDS